MIYRTPKIIDCNNKYQLFHMFLWLSASTIVVFRYL